MKISETKIKVRYAETDKMGIVHHSNYAIWFEAGRTDFLQSEGFSYKEIEEKGIMLPLYELKCRFISPAEYEDDIIVFTKIEELTRVRIVFSYEVINAKSTVLLAKGETMHAFTNKALKPVNAEKELPEIFKYLKEYTEI